MTPETVKQWLESPIVTYIRLRNPDINPGALFFEHEQIASQLETMFPDLSIDEVFLACTNPLEDDQRASVRRHLQDLGYSGEVLTLIAPIKTPSQGGPSATRLRGYEEMAELADLDLTYTELKQRGVKETMASHVRMMRKQLAPVRLEAAALALDTDRPWAEIGKQFGVGPSSITAWARVLKYQRERKLFGQ